MVNELLGIYRVKLPLPFRLDHINCYAIKGAQGWWIIDTGLNTKQSKLVWLEFMSAHQIEPTDIQGIYITHYHPDHYAAAGWFQKLSGAPVYMSRLDGTAAKRYWDMGEEAQQVVIELFYRHGMPLELATDVVKKMMIILSPMDNFHLTVVEPEGFVQLGDYYYRVVWTPGHTDGHLCFYNQENELLFSGDHLLPKITSNISFWPGEHPNPLANFLESLHQTQQLRCQVVLPAHGDPFDNLEERSNQLESHHRERLSLMAGFASQGATAFEICQQSFGENLPLDEVGFALSETLAHLIFLVNQGNLRLENHEEFYRYCV